MRRRSALFAATTTLAAGAALPGGLPGPALADGRAVGKAIAPGQVKKPFEGGLIGGMP